MNYDALLLEACENSLTVKEVPLKGNKGLIDGRKIAIRKDIPTLREKSCVLAEELGHYYTSSGNIIDLQDVRNRKQEHRARMWAYNKQVGLIGIIEAFNYNCRNLFEMAEYLDVTEEFLKETLKCYQQKYGLCTKIDNYMIYFEPSLAVIKMF